MNYNRVEAAIYAIYSRPTGDSKWDFYEHYLACRPCDIRFLINWRNQRDAGLWEWKAVRK